MEIIVGYLLGVLYFKCMLCVLVRIASEAILMSAHSIHLQDKRRIICLSYLEEIPTDSRTCSTHPW